MATTSRFISAEEILEERTALRKELGYVPHGTGRGWSSMLWISCDCPNCRDQYDPTGVESAKYLNMDPSSFFTDQSEVPSFAFSKIAKESQLFNAAFGFYFDNDVRVRTLEGLLEQLTPPLALYPSNILHVGPNSIDRFFLSTDKTSWIRKTWKAGRSVWYKEGENPTIPFEMSNEALRLRLKDLFA